MEPVRHIPTVPFDPEVETYTHFSGWYEAYEYTDWIDESMSWKRSAYIGDWSGLIKLELHGPDALRFFSDLAVNSFATYEIGQAKHAVLCNEHGKVMGEGILMRLGEDRFRFTSGPGAMWAKFKFSQGGYDAQLDDVTDQYSIQQVQGPKALAIMEEVTGESLRDIRFLRFRPAEIAGSPVLLLRQGMAGEIGFEIHGRWDDAARVYQRVLAAGERYDLKRLGGRTKMVNHVEASFPTPTVDYIPAWFDCADTEELRRFVPAAAWRRLQRHRGSAAAGPLSALYRSPVELGWGRSIRFDHPFLGDAALRAELAAPRRVLRTLVWNADDVGDVLQSFFRTDADPYAFMEWPRGLLGRMEADRVESGGREIGMSSSRCYSYFFREMLSLAVLDVEHADLDGEVTVIWGDEAGRQKPIRARVARTPYKTDNRRTDLSSVGAQSVPNGLPA
jgi:glycine cleavage system aminomethyltransferase T